MKLTGKKAGVALRGGGVTSLVPVQAAREVYGKDQRIASGSEKDRWLSREAFPEEA